MKFEYPPCAPPLHPDELEGLRLSHITNRAELDRWEQDNIVEAETWAFRKKTITADELLSVNFIRHLHKRMLNTIWKWAGEFRNSEKNIGVEPWSIGPALKDLLASVRLWIAEDVYPPDEIGARFHHRLVAIHPFVNGNGLLARLMTDLLLTHLLKQPHFTWGSRSLNQTGDCRYQDIAALQAADGRDYGPLFAFVRS